MVIGDMPVVVQDTSSSFEKPTESQSPGDERKSCNFEDDYFPDSAEHSPLHIDQGPDDDESVFMDSAAMTGPAAVSIDSAQHLLQSISSDDDGSRSPSPIRGSPGAFPASFPSPGVVRSPDTNDVPQVPVSSASVTIDDISSCEDFKVISLIGNLVSHDRHPFVKYAIRRFSHDLMLSLKNNSSFLSDIEIWCRDAFEDQDAVFLEDLLLLIELLPVDDITSVASLSQFLSNSKMFFESSFQLQAKRILKKWDSLRPKKFDSSTGAKDTGHVDSENPAEVNTSAADRPSRLPPNPKSNFRTRRNASHYGQPNHTTRRSSPAYSSYHSEFRRDEVSEQPTATPRKQPSPRRNSSPRNAIRTKMVDEVGAERRSGTSGHFSRDAPYRAQGGRMNDTNNPNSYHSRSGHDSQINRPSTHQFQSQRERSSSSFQQSYPARRVHDPSHRLESAPDSRSRNNDIFPSESPASSNRGPHSHRDPSSGHSFKRNDVYSEKDYYSDSEHRISNFTTRSASAPLKSFEGRIKTEYNKPRESAPSSYRSGAQESRSSKYPYDDGASRSQRQFHCSSTHNRSVTPPPAVRSRSPHSYRVDERLHHEDDRLENGSRDFRRYSTDTNPKPSFSQGSHYASSRGIKPPPRDNYRDYRREEDKDSRQSLTRDYRQDLTRDFRQEESQSSRHNDVSRDFHQPSSKRKPDFKWNHDGPSKSMRLSDEERRDLVQKGACLYCRKPGHTIENCRTRPARSSLPH